MTTDERPPTNHHRPPGYEPNELPNGWAWTTLGESCEVILGQSPPSSTYNTDGIGLPFYQGKAEFGDLYPTPVKWCSEPKKVAEASDVLISVRAPVGPTNLCRERSCIGRGLAAVRPEVGMPNLYFLYFLRYIEQDWEGKATGTTFSAISGKILKSQTIPLPPLSEQQRIVAKIEALFAQSRRGREALDAVPDLLAKFRQAVLAAAFRGALSQRNPADEPASVLLERIRAERRRKWEEDLRAQGKDPSRREYKEPAPPDTSDLPELPEGWCWVSLGQLLDRIDAGRSPRNQGRPAESDEFGVLKVSSVTWGEFLPEENKALLPGDEPGDTPTVKAGDLLISRANTIALVGAVVLVKQDYPNLMLSDKTLRLVPVSGAILPKYLLYVLRAQWVRDYFARQATGTSDSMRNISQAKIRATPIVLPSLAEQHRIVARIEALFTRADVLEAAATAAHRRLEQVDQAILTRAFRGELVEQDPEDEPAEVSLERIRAEQDRKG